MQQRCKLQCMEFLRTLVLYVCTVYAAEWLLRIAPGHPEEQSGHSAVPLPERSESQPTGLCMLK